MSQPPRLLSLLCCGLAFVPGYCVASAYDAAGLQDPQQRASTPQPPSPIVVSLAGSSRATLQRHRIKTDASAGPAHCDGVSLTALLQSTGAMPDTPLRTGQADRYVLVTGRDGDRVVFSLGELDPALGGLQAFLVERCEGGAGDGAAGALQLVVPGDRTPARDVPDVDAITVIAAP